MNDNELGLLTSKQLRALRCAREESLIRDYQGWWSPKFDLHFQCTTISSLWWRGLLESNFNNQRGFKSYAEAELVEPLEGGELYLWLSHRGETLLRCYDAWRNESLAA